MRGWTHVRHRSIKVSLSYRCGGDGDMTCDELSSSVDNNGDMLAAMAAKMGVLVERLWVQAPAS